MTTIVMDGVSKCYEKRSFAIKDINFTVSEGEIVAILGPSGCGKTTTLRIVAGFEKPCKGTLLLNNHLISPEDNWIPVDKRGVGMVFQDYALFPHLTAEQNILFGLDKKKVNKQAVLTHMLELVELSGLEKRYPHELSGGQKQRVALARALAPEPYVLLMDEPFSNLDAELKYSMRFEIRRILKKANISTIFVTHDQKDALAIADKIIVMNEGRIEQIGTPQEVYNEPKSPFVAKFISRSNLLDGHKVAQYICPKLGRIDAPQSCSPEACWLSIRRDQISLAEEGRFTGYVKDLAFEGEFVELTVVLENGYEHLSLLTNANMLQLPHIGQQVKFNINECRFIPKASEQMATL